MRESRWEETLLFQLHALKVEAPVRELKFDSSRRWRFDFAWPGRKVAAEVEGGIWSGGRHTTGSGFEKDCEKYNAATLQGWKIFRFTSSMIQSGAAFEMLQKIMRS